MGVFDLLDFDELVNIASSNERFRALISDHYMVSVFRIHEKLIRFSLNIYEREDPNMVIIQNNHTILPFLRNFGHLITNLQFLGEAFRVSHVEEIDYYIEQYCSATLTELDLDRAGTSLITNTRTSFPRVVRLKLTFLGHLDYMEINRIYPALEEFTIETNEPIPPNAAQFYSNLKRLNLLEYLYGDDSGVRELLRLNPQLNALRLRRAPTFNLLQTINATLPNLESLAIGYRRQKTRPMKGEAVHFENIKHFSIRVMDRFEHSHETPITFKQLQTLEISTNGFHIPLNLVQQNVELKSISLLSAVEKVAVRILNEAGPFRALEEIKMRLADIEDASSIHHVMNKFDTLKRVILIIYEFNDDALDLNAIQEHFQGEWLITDHRFVEIYYSFDVYYVTLTRI